MSNNLTLLDLMIIQDTLLGTLSIVNGNNLFKYKKEAIKGIINKIALRMNDIDVKIEDGEKEEILE